MTFLQSRFLFIYVCLFIFSAVRAQDTLKLTLEQADGLFLKNSFYLLASTMNIEAQRAQEIQAKLYPNPVFTAEFNVFDPEHKKAFHLGKGGEMTFQMEQLIVLGGKRKSEIELAKTNTHIAELEFQQLTANLKYQLHKLLYSVGQQEFLLQRHNRQLSLLDSLLVGYQTQVNNGNIPLKDLVRLKGAYMKLNNDRSELLNDYFDTQSELRKILQTSDIIQFEFQEKDIESYLKIFTSAQLQAQAQDNRPDLLILAQNNLLTEQYLQYQKRLAVPDINVYAAYDQRGGAFNNQINSGISISLPFWNRNQGNIKTAQFRLQESQYQMKSLQNEVRVEVQSAFALHKQTVTEYQKMNSLYNQDFEITFQGMVNNFQKRNISIIEFVDFFEAYNDVLAELTRIKLQLVSTAEKLNLLTGTKIY